MARSRLAVSARRQGSAEMGLRTSKSHNSGNNNGAATAQAVRQSGGKTCRWVKTNKDLQQAEGGKSVGAGLVQ